MPCNAVTASLRPLRPMDFATPVWFQSDGRPVAPMVRVSVPDIMSRAVVPNPFLAASLRIANER